MAKKVRKDKVGRAADREGLAAFAARPVIQRPSRYGYPDQEENDPTPIEMPLGSCRPTPLQDLIANMVRQAISQEEQEDFETLAESDDFEEEDPDVVEIPERYLVDVDQELPEESAALEDPDPEPEPTGDKTGDQPDPDAVEPDKA